jgi:hypothetical protein
MQTMGLSNVLVVAMVPTESARRNLEDQLARELATGGIRAVPSNRLVESVDQLDRDAVRALVQQRGFDSVLVASYLGTTREVEYVPTTTYYDYFDYWAASGMIQEWEEVKLEFRLFDARNGGRMVWSATTSTVEDDSLEEEVAEVADKVVARLEEDRGA